MFPRLYILAFVCIGFSIPQNISASSNGKNRINKNIVSPRRVDSRQPFVFYEPDRAAAEGLFKYADSTYRVPEIDTQDINYSNNSNPERHIAPSDSLPLGPVGHNNPHNGRKQNALHKILTNDNIPSGSISLRNFNPGQTKFRNLNPPQTNAISNNNRGQFRSNSFYTLSSPSFSTNKYFPTRQHVSNQGQLGSVPPFVRNQQQGRFPEANFPATNIRGQQQPLDFSGSLPTIDPVLRQSIPDFSRVAPQSVNTLAQPAQFPLQTNYIPAENFQQSISTPLIEIGKPPPPGYRIEENFQQSFSVSLEPEIWQRRKRSAGDNQVAGSSINSRIFSRASPFYQTPFPVQSNYEVPDELIRHSAPNQKSSSYRNQVPTRAKSHVLPFQVSSPNSYAVPNSYRIPKTPISKVYGVPHKRKGKKQGSINTKSQILFSPRLSAHRSVPFATTRILSQTKPPSSGFSPLDATIDLLTNIGKLTEKTISRNPATDNSKTLVVVQIKSFSVLTPPGKNSDLIEAQKNVGFGAHNFQFGDADTLMNVFENLLQIKASQESTLQTAYGVSRNTNNNDIDSGIDPMEAAVNLIASTDQIHTWAHNRGQQDAGKKFQSSPRDINNDAITFIDTAPITKTISAAVF